jgi:hypothetical protein
MRNAGERTYRGLRGDSGPALIRGLEAILAREKDLALLDLGLQLLGVWCHVGLSNVVFMP